MSVLVLGVGNILLTDEGIGVRVVEAIEQRYKIPSGIDVVDGGTAGMELLETMSRRDHVIIVDAVNTGAVPGTVVELRGDEVPALFRTRISPHQLGISDLLGVLTVTGEMPKQMSLFGAVPFSLETGVDLTEAMQERLETIVTCVVAELQQLGYDLTPIEPPLSEAV
ncbi:MAG: HyaD/HybD family hydrogenase maturation endopeptidase [Motiliproteus sp.]|nr:HyaD/HybD family hydrogenase maturation endopeptidase [Motiliproteus sp.]MCW9051832.1 HyaD/HybD family hydrogenase maturation endopeptidase [Motiliproteus sp.]